MKALLIVLLLSVLATIPVAAQTIVECEVLTADLNGDHVVDFADFFLFADQFGMVCNTFTDLPGGATMDFVWIEAGTFFMGSPLSESGRHSNEDPQHKVAISKGFYLGKYEVTQGQWESVMGSNPSYYSGSNHPVEMVSWHDVQEFIWALNAAAGDSLYRLPSEAEWEYVARAGSTSRWPFGDDESQLRDYAWYEDNNSPNGTKEVGTKLSNPWGLHDMHGNVYEWCQDWDSTYSSGASIDPISATSGSVRVLRGGYFFITAQLVRSASRSFIGPGSRYDGIGFRLLRIR